MTAQGSSTLYAPDRPRFVAVTCAGRTYRSPRRLAFGIRALMCVSLFLLGCGAAVGIDERVPLVLPMDRAALLGAGAGCAVPLIALLAWWTARLYDDVAALGHREMRCRATTAFFSWFVPIWNLSEPVEVLEDVWRITDPDDRDRAHWYERRGSRDVTLWACIWGSSWLCFYPVLLLPFATMNLVDRVTARMDAYAAERLGVGGPRRRARGRSFHAYVAFASVGVGIAVGATAG